MTCSVQHVKQANDIQTTVVMLSCSINNITQVFFFFFFTKQNKIKHTRNQKKYTTLFFFFFENIIFFKIYIINKTTKITINIKHQAPPPNLKLTLSQM